MAYYPVLLDLSGRLCVLVGGGRVAARKAAALAEAGARVRLIAPAFGREAEDLIRAGRTEAARRPYRKGDLRGSVLAVAATDDPRVNRAVCLEAKRRGVPCNVVDSPSLGTFIVPSVLRRGDLVVAISTHGAVPALCRRLRRDLERRIGPEYAEFLDLLREARGRLKAEIPDARARRRALRRLAGSQVLHLLRSGGAEEARARAGAILSEAIRAARAKSP